MKHEALIKQMTVAEKASLMSGANFWHTKAIERLNIPSIMMTDGPHGLRKQGGKADHLGLNASLPATCYPTAATLANSWDPHLLEEVGADLGAECVAEQVSALLGPGMNIKRNPLCGRNFEYFSEDPFLTGVLASAQVKGIQAQGVAACPKHFAVNSQEHLRMTIDEVVDERSLRELYLQGFQRVVTEAQPQMIMSSYNKVNGIYANEHPQLMNAILYDEWRFGGVMVTDWGGNDDRVAGLRAGNQLEMPSTNGITDLEIITAIEAHTLAETVLDEAVDRLLELVFSTAPTTEQQMAINHEQQHQRAVEAAKRSLVLLKNADNSLPLQATERVAIIGDFADKPRYQGAGSSLINPTKVLRPIDVLADSELTICGYAQGFKRMGGRSNRLMKEAVVLAQRADKVLLFVGLDESSEAEGVDRENLRLPDNQLAVIEALTALQVPLIVVLAGGGALELPFADEVTAIVHTYLAGQGGAQALVELLSGAYNPSGKLSETYPLSYEDVPSSPYYPGKEATSEHREGLFIGYRYFDTFNVPVRYPFGHGLSYTSYRYSDFRREELTVHFTVTNTGTMAGEEIAQLYIQKEQSRMIRAKRELKGFLKVALAPGEVKAVSITLKASDFAYYSVAKQAWAVEGGTYTLQIGSSIQSIHLSGTIERSGENETEEYALSRFPQYAAGNIHAIPDAEYRELLGYEPPAPLWQTEDALGMNDTIAQAKNKNWLGKLSYGLVIFVKKILELLKQPLWANNMYFVLNMPFRQVERFTGGKISRKAVLRYLRWVNGT